jgi:Mg/Co/Ni transporter MgtE
MNESDRLTLAYANRYPEQFAAEIATAANAEQLEVLLGLPAAAAARVTARLPASAFMQICRQQRDQLITWLNAASFDDAVALLARIPRPDQRTLVSLIVDRATRRRVRQFLNFPAHSVGAVAAEVPVMVQADTPCQDLLTELISLGSRREQPIVLTDSEGRYSGILSVWRLALTADKSTTVKDCSLSNIEPVQPEMSVLSARNLRQWQHHAWLPVVDHEQRVLGFVTREQILGTSETIHSDAEIFRESIAVLCLRYFEVMAELLERLFTGFSERRP